MICFFINWLFLVEKKTTKTKNIKQSYFILYYRFRFLPSQKLSNFHTNFGLIFIEIYSLSQNVFFFRKNKISQEQLLQFSLLLHLSLKPILSTRMISNTLLITFQYNRERCSKNNRERRVPRGLGPIIVTVSQAELIIITNTYHSHVFSQSHVYYHSHICTMITAVYI